jgi:outer membrane immunogenic protein
VNTVTTNVFSLSSLKNIGSAEAFIDTGTTCPDDNGFIAGGQWGYNWQFTNWVIGLETDIQGASNNNDQDTITNTTRITTPGLPPNTLLTGIITSSKDLKWLGTVRGRLGFLAAPSFLVYGTGGLAYGKVEATTTISDNIFDLVTNGSLSDKRTGWTVGGGVEWMFAPHWSVKAEYLYYDLGQVTWSLADINQIINQITPVLQTASQSTTRFNGNIVRAGINWHF